MSTVFWKVKRVQPESVLGSPKAVVCLLVNYFFGGGSPATLKSGHRDVYDWNKPPQHRSLSAPAGSQFRGIGSSMAHKIFTVLTTHATDNRVAMSTTCTEIPNA